VEIFEITQTNDVSLRNFKDSNRDTFAAAMDLMARGETASAARLLEAIRSAAPVLADPVVDARLAEIEDSVFRAARDACDFGSADRPSIVEEHPDE
jgi:hypothetical protein